MIAIESLAPDQFAIVAQWLSNPEINQWLSSEWRGRAIDPVVISVAVRNKRNRFYLIRLDAEPCGVVALADWDSIDNIAMIWYALGRQDLGGRGVASEAVNVLTGIAFGELHIQALHAWIREDNIRSRRVLEKNHFREVGRLRSAVSVNGERRDRIYFDRVRLEKDPKL